MSSEQERVQQMMLDQAHGNETGRKLVWDPLTKTIRADDPSRPDQDTLKIHRSDMEHFADGQFAGRITLAGECLATATGHAQGLARQFRRLDGEAAYSDLAPEAGGAVVSGSVLVTPAGEDIGPTAFGQPQDEVRVVASPTSSPTDTLPNGDAVAAEWTARGYIRDGADWQAVPVDVVPVRAELFSRARGLLESGLLADKCVFTVGLGSGGAPIVLELAKLGITRHILMDHDRLEVANVGRHVAGLRDVGRRKTAFMAERLRDKNPYVQVETHDRRVAWDTQELVRDCIRRSDLVIAGVDDRQARVILNKLCLAENKPLIVPGAFRRAYGGQVLFVEPRVTPCYECFLAGMPDRARDEEIASADQAARLAYSDRPVPIEPGLSNDIAPISQMVVKLALQYLLRGRPTTLRSLDADLVAPWYLWLNRREPGTDYAELDPLGFTLDGLHVMRWYGIDFDRNPACPACGDGRLLDGVSEAASSDEVEVFAAETAAA
jgi:molybdopterin/thiamine biosynthesis adenylyltransferase